MYNLFNYLLRRGEFELDNIDFPEYNLMEIEKKLYPKFKLKLENNED